MKTKTETFRFQREPRCGFPHEFDVHVTTDGLTNSINIAWVLAVEEANRFGPYKTHSLSVVKYPDDEENGS
jgi:hypothetical protein